MTDAQISQWIQTQRPDYVTYYNTTLNPGANATATDPGLLAWAHNQFQASPGDLAQFNAWTASQPTTPAAGTTGTGTTTTKPAPTTSPTPSPTVSDPGIGLGSLVSPTGSGNDLTSQAAGALQAGIARANTDASGTGTTSTNQVQGSQQQGAFSTVGQTDTTGTQQQTGTQTGTTTTAGQTAGTTAGTVAPVDTLGLGGLLSGQIGNAGTATGAEQNFLEGILKGTPQQQAQTSQAVSNALSGPGMVGAGEGAQARAAGIAGGQVGVNNLNSELQAASSLGGPTAATTLAGAGNPFVGQQNTGATTGTQTGTQNTLNLSDLLNQSSTSTGEAQSGSSGADSTQVATGQVPQSNQSSSGGCYACTVYADMGEMHKPAIRRGAMFKLSKPEYLTSLIGYSVYGPALARLILRSGNFARWFKPVARVVLYEECRLAHGRLPRRLDAIICHFIFNHGSALIGLLSGRQRVLTLDVAIQSLLRRNNLSWEVSK